jgi:hypothetical protein
VRPVGFGLGFLFGLETDGAPVLEAVAVRFAALGFCTSGQTTGWSANFAAMRSRSGAGDMSCGVENNRAVSILGASIADFWTSFF